MTRAGWNGNRVRRWRAYWAPRIIGAEAAGQPLLCPFCHEPVRITQQWDVDHAQALAEEGDQGLANQRPAHTSCNRRAGQAIARTRATERRTRVRRWT